MNRLYQQALCVISLCHVYPYCCISDHNVKYLRISSLVYWIDFNNFYSQKGAQLLCLGPDRVGGKPIRDHVLVVKEAIIQIIYFFKRNGCFIIALTTLCSTEHLDENKKAEKNSVYQIEHHHAGHHKIQPNGWVAHQLCLSMCFCAAMGDICMCTFQVKAFKCI